MTAVADLHLHGFDVSHWQPPAPDFTAAGRRFGICKATEGTTDPNFARNRDAMHAQGLAAVGLYHFARPDKPAVAQADRFVAAIGQRREREFFVLDYEKDPWSEAWAVQWINNVKAALGGPVLFYTYRAMLDAHPHDQIRAAADGLWVAAYSRTSPRTDWPWTFWQHTNGTTAADGPWDCSVFRSNDETDLAAFVGAGPTQGDPFMALTDNEQHDLLTAALETRKIIGNLQDVDGFHQAIEKSTLAAMQEALAILKDPDQDGGAGEITPATIARIAEATSRATAEDLAKRLTA